MKLLALGVVIALASVACAPDSLDTYTSAEAESDAPPPTRPPLPTTTVEPVSEGAANGGDDLAEAPPTFEPNGETVEVRSLDNSFIQASIEIDAGTEVNWLSGGRNDHNILPVDESLTWGVDRDTFVPGSEYAHVFDTPGVYPYYCSIHGTKEVGMVGAIVVNEPS